ncbi:HEAT repeat domain-containing protein [Candidatus Gracilibacteria bacterium]|nr:HEAT repeat domain-containing protein [Candidatus Gracilibacteria bacterium]NJP19659.1 HEAT repeat domain-containing protein [Hydrococcus sp. CRU_1_1]
MKMYYRFPIFLAICVLCLGFTQPNNRRELLAQAASNLSTQRVATRLLAQVSTTDDEPTFSLSEPKSAYDRYMKAGYDASRQKNYPTALENFQKALKERPNDIYAQQAIQNTETAMNRPSALWWTAGGVGLALAIGGGLFFVSGLMRKITVQEKERERIQQTVEKVPMRKTRERASGGGGEKQYDLPTLPPNIEISSENGFAGGHTEVNSSDNSSALPLQTTTRLPNLDEIDELVKDLHEPDPKKRRKAIWSLAQKGDSRAMKPLVDLMIDSDSQERSLILEALSQISIRTLKPMNQALAISLQDKNPQVRKNAIRDLTRIYDLMSQISQMLRHAMDDSDADVQETAKWALNQLNLQMTPTRLDLLPMQQNETMP